MKKHLGFILTSNKYYAILVVPFHFIPSKYQKIQIKIKKYYVINYRQEYIKGDIVIFDSTQNKIYIHFK